MFNGTDAGGAVRYECRTLCDIVPLQAVTAKDCNWGSLHDPSRSVSGMKGRWASLFMERTNSSLSAAPYGRFPYAGLVRLLPTETRVELAIYVDKSIVEAFAMGGQCSCRLRSRTRMRAA